MMTSLSHPLLLATTLIILSCQSDIHGSRAKTLRQAFTRFSKPSAPGTTAWPRAVDRLADRLLFVVFACEVTSCDSSFPSSPLGFSCTSVSPSAFFFVSSFELFFSFFPSLSLCFFSFLSLSFFSFLSFDWCWCSAAVAVLALEAWRQKEDILNDYSCTGNDLTRNGTLKTSKSREFFKKVLVLRRRVLTKTHPESEREACDSAQATFTQHLSTSGYHDHLRVMQKQSSPPSCSQHKQYTGLRSARSSCICS